MRIVHTQLQEETLHAVSSPYVQYSFTMSLWGFRVIVSVVYLAGYRFARDISGTVVLLAIIADSADE